MVDTTSAELTADTGKVAKKTGENAKPAILVTAKETNSTVVDTNKEGLSPVGASVKSTDNTNATLSQDMVDTTSAELTALQLIPWCAAVLLSLAVGGLIVQNRDLRKQGLYFEKLRTRVLEAKESIYLLDKESQELLREAKIQFEEQIRSSNERIDVSSKQTNTVVDDFKQKLESALNGVMGAVSNELAKVVSHTSNAQDEAKQTRELMSATTDSIDRKDREIQKLQKGYQASLLMPLLQPFMEIRDELVKERSETKDALMIKSFSAVIEKIDFAFNKIGVLLTNIQVGKDPEEYPVHFWEALASTEETEREDFHRKVFRVIRPGYYTILPGLDADHGQVLRKAVVILYRFEPPQPAQGTAEKASTSSPSTTQVPPHNT